MKEDAVMKDDEIGNSNSGEKKNQNNSGKDNQNVSGNEES